MLRRPEGLDRLIEYSETSCIPPQFADAVDVVRVQVHNSRNREPGLALETANRLFRFEHPFRHELTARYALYFGQSVGIVRAFWALAPAGQSIDEANTYQEYQLKERVYINCRLAQSCESEATHAGWPLLDRFFHWVKVLSGLDASLKDLQVAPGFLERHFSQQTNVGRIILLAQN